MACASLSRRAAPVGANLARALSSVVTSNAVGALPFPRSTPPTKIRPA